MFDFFVSYAREDGEFVRALVERLTGHDWDVWLDEKDIPPSVPWMAEVQRAIEESMMLIAVESAAWRASNACGIEVGLAQQSRVPMVTVAPDLERLDEVVEQVVRAYRALPSRRAAALEAAAAAALWDSGGRRRALLARGQSLSRMREALAARPEDISPTATVFIKNSTSAAVRRWLAGPALGFIAPVLIGVTWLSSEVIAEVDERVARNIAEATAIAERSTYADWNIYAGLERSPADVSTAFTAYRQLFTFLAERTPSSWDPTPISTIGPTEAVSSDGTMTARVDGSAIVVVDASGVNTRLLASAPVSAIAWSPDDQWIAASTGVGADVLSVVNSSVIPLRGGAGASTAIAWTDEQDVAAGGPAGTGTWRVFDTTPIASLNGIRYGATVDDVVYTVDAGGTLTRTDTLSGLSRTISAGDIPEGASPVAVESSMSQIVVAFTGSPAFLRVVEISTESVRDIPVPACSPVALSIAPDAAAAYLACFEAESNQTRVDLATGAVNSAPMQTQTAYGVRALTDRVLWGGIYGGVFQSGVDLQPQGALTGEAGCNAPIRKLIGLADGSYLFQIGDATGSFGCASRIQMDGEVKVNRLVFGANDGHAAPDGAMSPDGALIAYGMSDGTVRVFTTKGLEPVYFAQVMPDQVRAISFSSDSRSLIVAGLGGRIVSVPIPFFSMREGAAVLADDALTRLQSAVDWGIYAPTMDRAEPGE